MDNYSTLSHLDVSLQIPQHPKIHSTPPLLHSDLPRQSGSIK